MRVCMRVCVYAHFAEVSKIVQDAPRAGATTKAGCRTEHKHRSDHPQQEHKRPPQEPDSEHQQAPEHARIKRNYKCNSKLIFF